VRRLQRPRRATETNNYRFKPIEYEVVSAGNAQRIAEEAFGGGDLDRETFDHSQPLRDPANSQSGAPG
jgi:hypothetical protein